MTDALLLSGLAGLAAIIGAFLGWFDTLKQDWLTCPSKHGIMAFGGGALLAAVGLVLVPKGMADTPLFLTVISFLAGAVFFLAVNRFFIARGTPFCQFMAMMLDFVPEAIVLGALVTQHYTEAVFLAVLIAAQNLPEGFNAFREMTAGPEGLAKRRSLFLLTLAGASGIAWGLLGYLCFSPADLSLKLLMLFCAGGIFFLVFHDIAPVSREKRWLPSLGSVLGFMVGIIGHGLI
mgnify:CR=1 FL=1